MAAPQRRDLPPLEEGFYFYFFSSLSLSFSYLSYGALFRPLLWLALARVRGNMCHGEGWLSHQNWTLLLHPCTRFAGKDPFAARSFSLSLLLFLSLFVGFRRVIDSALRLSTAGYAVTSFPSNFFSHTIFGKVERKLRERVSRARSGSERFTGDRILTLKLGNLAELFELTSTIPSPPLLLCTIVKNAAR